MASREVLLKGPLQVEVRRALIVTDQLGVVEQPEQMAVDAVTREMKKVPPGWTVCVMDAGILCSQSVATPYEAINLALWLDKAFDFTTLSRETMAACQRAVRARLLEWKAAGGWLGKPMEELTWR